MLILMILSMLLAFYLLAEVCDKYFVESLEKISQRLHLSPEAAGATFMAIGSSAPELFVSLMALFKPGEEAMGAGTIVGSAIFNVLVITVYTNKWYDVIPKWWIGVYRRGNHLREGKSQSLSGCFWIS